MNEEILDRPDQQNKIKPIFNSKVALILSGILVLGLSVSAWVPEAGIFAVYLLAPVLAGYCSAGYLVKGTKSILNSIIAIIGAIWALVLLTFVSQLDGSWFVLTLYFGIFIAVLVPFWIVFRRKLAQSEAQSLE